MTTPARAQYLHFKTQYPDALLLYRLGDFYELFDEDARIAARDLDLTLTGREFGQGQRVPMAGVPHHAVETYIARLIARGYKVAICEQLGDPKLARGLVEREVVRVVTPGTITEASSLDAKRNNYLAAFVLDNGGAGLAWVDVTTGEFMTSQLRGTDLGQLVERELARIGPAECIWPSAQRARTPLPGADEAVEPPPVTVPGGCHISPYEPHAFALTAAMRLLRDHFGLATLDGEAWGHLPLAISAAGGLLAYLRETQRSLVPQLRTLALQGDDDYMVLDATTRRNLELTRSLTANSTDGSLITILDRTVTPMGGRRLRRWLNQPLRQVEPLRRRHDAVEALVSSTRQRLALGGALALIADVERLTGRLLQGTIGPREMMALARTFERVPGVIEACADMVKATDGRAETEPRMLALAPSLYELSRMLDVCEDVCGVVRATLVDDPPPVIGEGGAIRPGHAAELDEIHASVSGARAWMAALEGAERERTGIRSLRVGYNRVFGYYIEVSNASLTQVPTDYTRKQTLANGERFVTPELKRHEALILSAQERTIKLEAQLFAALREGVAAHAGRLLRTAEALAVLDVYCSLATVACDQRYARPTIDGGTGLHIGGGRHPVVEVTRRDIPFVGNDVDLDPDSSQIVVLTGPNMAGKSTYLRQTALIVLLAQIGSFVPAEHASIGVVDRIFTRVGAQDDLATGQSTFMVEMVETAAILRQMTERSLLILDEIGRGTSTLDGLAIAQAVVEHLHSAARVRPKTIFATHYHELTTLAEGLSRVRNYRMDVLDNGAEVVFLRRVVAGGADKSYGIHVAELAGLPPAVIKRARVLLRTLEERALHQGARGPRGLRGGQLPLLDLMTLVDEDNGALEGQGSGGGAETGAVAAEAVALADELAKVDVINLTPLQALQRLADLQGKAAALAQPAAVHHARIS